MIDGGLESKTPVLPDLACPFYISFNKRKLPEICEQKLSLHQHLGGKAKTSPDLRTQ